MGFRTDEIKNIYLDRYFKMKDWFYNVFPHEKVEAIIPSMTLGEHSLACLSKYYNWKSTPLYDENQYLHMYGGRKHLDMFYQFAKSYLENREFKTYKDNGNIIT